MEIQALTTAQGVGHLQAMHASLNAAYNAIAVDRVPGTLDADVSLARDYVTEARTATTTLLGTDGADDAAAAARQVLPRLEQALQLLDQLGVSKDAEHVTPLLDELGIAMDHVEQALVAVGAE